MKKSYNTIFFLLFLAMFCLGLSSQSHADDISQHIKAQKIYVVPEQLVIIPDGIFYANETGEIIPVQYISKDDHGIFILGTYCTCCGTYFEKGSCPNSACPFNNPDLKRYDD